VRERRREYFRRQIDGTFWFERADGSPVLEDVSCTT
jgi:hypothetical protein